jgi:glycerol-3-phosphate dehydrogenase
LAPGVRLVPSRGSHLVLRAGRLGSPSAALTVPLPGSRSRYVFALPQPEGLVYLGLTDEPVSGPVPDTDPQPTAAEVDQLLATVNQVLATPLTSDDVVGSYAGLRPLVLPSSAGAGPGGATADLSRRHLLQWDGPVLTVVGGKLTTYRAMAAEAVDAVVALGAEPVVDGRPETVGSCASASGPRVRGPSPTCSTGVPGSAWFPPTPRRPGRRGGPRRRDLTAGGPRGRRSSH